MPKPSSPDVSQITEYLYISAWPRGDHADEIRAMNVRLILSMHWIRPAKALGRQPVKLIWLPTFDNPVFPMPIRTFQRGVGEALPVIQNGYGVLVHCRAGVHRSVAMACCVLIGMGLNSEEAMKLVEQKRAVADPRVKHILPRIILFEQQWHQTT